MFDKNYLYKIQQEKDSWEENLKNAKERDVKFVTDSDIPIKQIYTPLDVKGDYFERVGFPAILSNEIIEKRRRNIVVSQNFVLGILQGVSELAVIVQLAWRLFRPTVHGVAAQNDKLRRGRRSAEFRWKRPAFQGVHLPDNSASYVLIAKTGFISEMRIPPGEKC